MPTDPMAEAHRKITRALKVIFSWVSASMTLTPEAIPVAGSYSTSCTMEFGRRVILPVRSAAGRVQELLLK